MVSEGMGRPPGRAWGKENRTTVRPKARRSRIEAVYQAKQTKRLFEKAPAAHYPLHYRSVYLIESPTVRTVPTVQRLCR